jgi:hypothetical protein
MYLYQSYKWSKDLPMNIMEIVQLVPVLVILTHTQVKAFSGAWLGIRGAKRFVIVSKISKKLKKIHGLQEKQVNQ